jgi:hypothetical protein
MMAVARRMLRATLAIGLMLVIFGGGWLAGRTGLGSVVETASLTDLERQFAERMQNVSLVGSFTVAGRDSRESNPDRYDIRSVEKVGDNQWRFNARMDCCGVSGATLPIVVPMRWVGDTPVIMMTDTSIPGIGTFTVRVFFYGDRYAGTWQHGNVGGHMFGRIEKQGKAIM